MSIPRYQFLERKGYDLIKYYISEVKLNIWLSVTQLSKVTVSQALGEDIAYALRESSN